MKLQKICISFVFLLLAFAFCSYSQAGKDLYYEHFEDDASLPDSVRIQKLNTALESIENSLRRANHRVERMEHQVSLTGMHDIIEAKKIRQKILVLEDRIRFLESKESELSQIKKNLEQTGP